MRAFNDTITSRFFNVCYSFATEGGKDESTECESSDELQNHVSTRRSAGTEWEAQAHRQQDFVGPASGSGWNGAKGAARRSGTKQGKSPVRAEPGDPQGRHERGYCQRRNFSLCMDGRC